MKQEVDARFIFVRLCDTGMMVEQAGDLTPVILRHLPPGIKASDPFFDFKQSVREIGAIGPGYKQALQDAIRFPATLFNWHDMDYIQKASAALIPRTEIASSFSRAGKSAEIEVKPPSATAEIVSKEKPKQTRNRKSREIDFADLKQTILDTFEAALPIGSNKKVEFGNYKGTTWANVNAALRVHARKNPDCGFDSLTSYMKKEGLQRANKLSNRPVPETEETLPLISPRTTYEVIQILSSHIKRSGAVPPLQDGYLTGSFNRARVEDINHSLARGELAGLKSVFGAKTPKNIEQVLLYSGFAAYRGKGESRHLILTLDQ
ncbi:MAG: hypothetical protein DI586_08165 [Micavibrio aeruginosavorus]|uniref:Uncharacterized protein n=1 Tax=Micavibrio aeruginosavorus TaxID=349221 RepID=A0A2W5FGF7_9BACT|nr:MAG: hypothetical protein DI586_08165 [Micavibrio aeruginosavorus]